MRNDNANTPPGWTATPIDALADVLVSNVDKKEYLGDIRVQLCNYTDVYYSDNIDNSEYFMWATATSDQIARFTPRKGDVPITKDSESANDIGRPSLVTRDLPGVVYGYHLAIYRPHSAGIGSFLKYFFESAETRFAMQAKTPGVTRVGLSQDTLRHLRVPYPGAEKAKQISSYLDRETAEIDELTADLEIASRLAIEKSQTRWDDDLDGISLNAESRHLKFCLSAPLSYGANLPADQAIDGDVRYLRITDFAMDGTIRESTRRTLPMNLALDHMVEPGDILIARSGATVGKSFLVPSGSERACYAGYLIRARPSRAVNPKYLYATLNSSRFWHWVDQNKTVATIPNINAERYGQYRVPVPSLGAQENAVAKFEEAASARRAMLQDFDRATALAKERRAALITAAVTGQIDVTAKRRPAAEQLEDDIKELS